MPAPRTAHPDGRVLRLADFILANREPILVEWEAFARTCLPAGGTMDVRAARDHASEMLTVIAADLARAQDAGASIAKSKGQRDAADADPATAAGEHGAARADSGFTIAQMLAEFRALRASVIRLWAHEKGELAGADVDDLTRFNEAVDQALAESVTRFDEGMEQAKETFLAILAHDLRTPLGAIYSSAAFMLETGELEEPHRSLTARVAVSAKRAAAMVADLLDFTRSRLGGGIPIARAEMSLGRIVRDAVDEISAAHPGRRVQVDTRGEQRGRWDAARLSQAFGNLIGNAVQHGGQDSTVTVRIEEQDGAHVAVAIHNHGVPIPSDQLDGIFNPMKAAQAPAGGRPAGPMGGLGLGLYIAEQIVSAHGGRISIASSEAAGTTFTVVLPRDEAAP